jgi:hypothetical protein
MMSGNFKVDCDYKFNLYPSDYAKKITGVNKPVGSLVILAKGSYIMVSPNIMAIDGKSSILDIQTIKQGKSKVRVALPSNKIYTEVKSFDDIFGSIDKIEKILPIPKKIDEEKPPVKKEDIDKVKDDMKTEISYVGLNQVNNEKVHQIKFKFSDKKSKKEIFTILLDTTDPNYDIRRVSLAHKLIQGGLLINKLDFKKASIDDVNAIESSINSYKKVNLSEFKDVLYSSVIVNVFKLLK